MKHILEAKILLGSSHNRATSETVILHPKTGQQLKGMILNIISADGIKANLNNIDVSEVEDFSMLFANSPFNGDISKWNPARATNMTRMFYGSKFDGDLSNWAQPAGITTFAQVKGFADKSHIPFDNLPQWLYRL